MKKIIFILCLLLTSFGALAGEDCPTLSFSQKVNMMKASHYGETQMGKGWGITLAAIAFQESDLGMNVINKRTQDYGIFQNHLKTVVKRNKVSPNYAKAKLLNDFDYAVRETHKELQFWAKVHGKNRGSVSLHKVLASYNGGYAYHKEAPQKYSKEVFANMKVLATCELVNNLK